MIMTLEEFKATKIVLNTQKQIKTFFEKQLGINYDKKHPYFRMHTYYGPSYLYETKKGLYCCEIENTYSEGTIEQMEKILFDWAFPMSQIDPSEFRTEMVGLYQ